MSTTYYIRRLSIVNENKDKIKELIDKSVNGEYFKEILNLVNKTYGTMDKYDRDLNVIKIGHRAGGWKFLWVPNCWEEDEGHYNKELKEWVPNIVFKQMYDLTKEGLTNFIMDPDNVVVDEYGEVQDKNEFIEMAFNWNVDGIDMDDHIKNNPNLYKCDMSKDQEMWKRHGYEFKSIYSDAFYSDGLRFCIFEFL